MRIVLPDALHARPANLLVRLAAQHGAVVHLRKGTCRADARKILDVLSLGAAKGDEIEIVATGEGAAEAIEAIAQLVSRNFDGDLVPETGSAAVEGIAIGRAVVVRAYGRETRQKGTREEERARLDAAERRALEELDALITSLAPEERVLFEPERAIVSELVALTAERVDAGEACEDAIASLTEKATTDLLLDARARLLEALAEDGGITPVMARARSTEEDLVLVVEMLTPSIVAMLPAHVRGIVAVDDAPDAGTVRTSHAAILARGRELPLALVPAHVAMAITDGDAVVIDTTSVPARVWVQPSQSLLEEARARRAQHLQAGHADVAREIELVSRTLGVSLLVNVGSLHDRVPEGAAGVGLLRTELLFAGRATAPGEGDQLAALLAVARAARGGAVTARLFDAGGDKPLPWLPARDPGALGARGAALLFEHPAVLHAQLAAIARAAERANVRALIPMVRGAADVDAVRARVPRVPVGAMIETPEAAADADAIAATADFVCVGTNDLAALVVDSGLRGDASRALDRRVLALIERVVAACRAHGRRVTICGEVAADPRGARILVGLGVDALSVSPQGLGEAARALVGLTRDECRAAARAALEETP